MSIGDFRRGARPFVVALAVIAAALMAFVAIRAVGSFRHPVFPWDMWDTVELYRGWRDGEPAWSSLWAMHNEHRIFFPRLAILADYFLGGAGGGLLTALNALLHGAGAWLLIRAYRETGVPGRRAVLYACVTVMSFLWLKQRENFIWPFQVAWMLNTFFSILAAYLVSRPGRNLLPVAACCVVAAFSLANGILLPFVIGAVIWREGGARRRLAAWAAFAVLLAAVYLWGYSSDKAGDAERGLAGFAAFFAAYLGNAVIFEPLPKAVAVLLGVFGLLLFGWLSGRFLSGKDPAPYSRFAFAVTSYAVATALVTAWGRHTFGLAGAGAGRYVTTTMLFWMTLFGWFVSRCDPRARRRAFAAALAVCLLYLLPTQFLYVGKMREKYVEYDEASLALIAGVEDSSALFALYPTSKNLWPRREVLRQGKLSVYRERWAGRVGAPAEPGPLLEEAVAHVEEVRFAGTDARPGYYVRGRVDGMKDLPEALLLARGDSAVGAARLKGRGCAGCFSGYVSGTDSAFDVLAWDEGRERNPARLVVRREAEAGAVR